ncbi:hypothetical protein TNCV_4867031 [Trichonephila clavipes]|nr:hypothetical protein TNCV_4867031 [Trichonephila clavipes]
MFIRVIMWIQTSPASSTLSIGCYGWKGMANSTFRRLVDVGALLGRSKVYKFAKRFDNLAIQGKDVLPAHKPYPIMTQKVKTGDSRCRL